MDGGKRDAGRAPADVADKFPGAVACRSYEEFVALYLNCERVRANRVGDMTLAMQIALGEVKYPREWRQYEER